MQFLEINVPYQAIDKKSTFFNIDTLLFRHKKEMLTIVHGIEHLIILKKLSFFATRSNFLIHRTLQLDGGKH